MRTREKPEYLDLPDGIIVNGKERTHKVCVSYSYLKDSNNRATKVNSGRYPQSYCAHYSATSDPILARAYTGNYAMWNVNANTVATTSAEYLSPVFDEHFQSLLKNVINKQNQISNDFSSLNFFYELREIGSLIKSIEKYRFIDWQFAISPTISDLKTALSRYNRFAAESKTFKDRYTKIFVGGKRTATRSIVGDGITTPDFQLTGKFKIESRLKCLVSLDVPWLVEVSPTVFSVLDSLAIDPSASNAWNAIPWSWFVDWFFPMGTFLESLPSALRPRAHMDGTISHTVTGESLESYSSSRSVYFNGRQKLGTHKCKLYIRKPLNDEPYKFIKWNPVFGINSAEKVAVLRDIAFPVKDKKK